MIKWPKLILPSSRAFVREARRTEGYSFLDLVHGYVYARWVYLYIAVGIGEHLLSRLFAPLFRAVSGLLVTRKAAGESISTTAETYHGKVVSVDEARRLVSVRQDIALTNLEQVIPYRIARDIVVKNPERIVVLDCPCRVSRENPCLPLDVCLIVGEPFASFVAEHHPDRARWITQREAEEIICQEHERGHVQHAFFKDAMLGRFYAICNCCACCCGAMQAWQNGTPMLISSGYVAQVDSAACVGCGQCESFCQFDALLMDSDSGVVQVDWQACMGCGVCVSRCQSAALSLERDPLKGEPLEIERLMAEAAACA